MNRFLQGWQKILGGTNEESRPSVKPFPKNRFYTPEELNFLSKSEEVSTIDKWAIATGKWAFEQSRGRATDSPFAPVQWQDGLMATWIDGRLTPDSQSRQAEKLALLKEEGFDIPEKYENVITNYDANRLVGNYFASNDGNSIIKVDSYDKGHLATDTPKFTIQSWNSNSLSSQTKDIDYATFKAGIGHDYTLLSDTDRNRFLQQLNTQEQGKKQFNKIMSDIHRSYPIILGGTFTLGQSTVHKVDDLDGKVLPVSWSLDKGDVINVGVYTKDSNVIHNLTINESTAYRYGSLLDTINDSVQRERVNETTLHLVETLGTEFGENTIFAKSNNEPLVMAKEGVANAVVSTRDGRTFAFNLDSHEEIALDKQERKDLLIALKMEGITEQTKLRDKISIPQMKDYVESMRDKENILSGDMDLLPSRSTVNKLYCEYEHHSEEFHSYTHSSFPMSAEDRNEMLADLETSHLAFRQEMAKMLDAYNSKSYTIDEKDVRKLERLDAILDRNTNEQTTRYHKKNKAVPQTKAEVALRDSLVEKMRSNGMDVITDAEEAAKVHDEATSVVRDMGSRTYKRMEKIGKELEGRELSKEQNAVVQVYSGVADNLSFIVDREEGRKTIVMRQGNDFHAGTKHSVYGHYGTNKGVITSDDILRIPELIKNGERKITDKGKAVYSYIDTKDNVKYTIITEPRNDREFFNDFYTNKKALSLKTSEYLSTRNGRTAHNDNNNTFISAKVQQNNDKSDKDAKNLSEFKTLKGEIWGFTTNGKIYLDNEAANAETPIHEYTHIWAEALRENNPKEWNNIVGLMKGTTFWSQVQSQYPELKTDSDIADEVLATYSGQRGAERLRKEMNIISTNGKQSQKAAAMMSLTRVEHALNKFWRTVANFLGIHFTTAELVADRPLKDLLNGVDPRIYIKDGKKSALPLREHRTNQGQYRDYYVEPSLLQTKTEGRWHTQEHLAKKAYGIYGSLLADNANITASKNEKESIPMDLDGHKYSGATAMILNIESKKRGYELPVFANLSVLADRKIRVKENAVGIPVMTDKGIENVYNIEQTDFPVKHPQDVNNMKLNQVLESRMASEDKNAICALVNSDRFTTRTVFDHAVGFASYSSSDNTIHIAPTSEYEKTDGMLQDLSEGLVRSTRKEQADSSRFANVLTEDLIAHVGSRLIGQKYGYDVGAAPESRYWKERLKTDPNYTKKVILSAEASSDRIVNYVNKLQSQNSNLDLRSATPVDIDVDGNGVVESQENLEADKKQGVSEEKGADNDESHHQEHKFHRAR